MPAELPKPLIITKQIGDVRIHTFIASFTYDNIANATHVIESKSKLVLIDGQFFVTYAKQFREYVNRLAKDSNKPIERLYVSHRHPDHWFGLDAAFKDLKIYALQETIDYIKDKGEALGIDHKPKMGKEEAPQKIFVPQYVVHPGEETIDGVRYIFEKVVDTEIDVLLTIKLPEKGVHFVQDLIYSGTHLYLYAKDPAEPTKDIKHWIEVLQSMLTSDYELFMPGHGLPADKNEVARNIEYLSAAKQAIDNGLIKGAFKDYMLKRYPARLCPGIFDIYLPRLFGTEGQF